MAQTGGSGAGVSSTNTTLAIIREAVWGVTPTANGTKVNRLRVMSDTLAKTKSKQRVNEIDGFDSAGDMVTMSAQAGGDLKFGFSALNFEEFMLGAIGGSEWPAATIPLTAAASITDDVNFYSWTIVKDFGSSLITTYPGSYISKLSLSLAQGNFVSGTATFLCADEVSNQSAVITPLLPYVAPVGTGRVLNATKQYQGTYVNDQIIGAVVDTVTLDLTNDGASLEFGLGSEAAQGVNPGTFTVSGSMSMYFRDYSIYTYFQNETSIKLSFTVVSALGNYTFTLFNVTLNNPKIQAGGKGQPIKATFDFDAARGLAAATSTNRTIMVTRNIGTGP